MLNTRTKAGMIAFLACIAFAWLTLQLFSPPKSLPASADTLSFSAERAMEHLKIIAKEPHSVGTPANEEVIKYLVKELEALGLDVHIQDTLVSRVNDQRKSTRVSRVKNIIGVLKGTNSSKGVMLMAHHDSQPNTPGAADDGSGVVAILESVRAIKAEGTLQNDLIVLITDNEESGLLGAKAFVDYHPLLKEVGVVINLEARGNRGTSVSFEMNDENGWIVREFKRSAPYPFANSMAYEIYKIMPNDTDFSMFRETEVAGVNSATVEGFVHYHSMTDTPENISHDLVQNHGANMLGMARHFGNIDLKNTKAEDAVFFNPIGSNLIIYPAKYNLAFILLMIALFVATIILGIRRHQVVLPQMFIGIGYFLVILAISGIGSFLLQQGILALHPHYTLFYANNFYNVEYYFFAFLGLAGFFYAVIFGFQPELNGLSLSLGGVLMLVMMTFGLMLGLPTGSYVIYYPLIGYLIVQLVLLVLDINAENKPVPYAIGQFLALVPAIGLWSQTIYLLFETFGLTQAIVAPVILFCFLGILMIPILRMISLWKKRILNTFGVLTILYGLVGGAMTADYTKENPLQAHLMYGVDKDHNNAVWATNKRYKNDWVGTLIPNGNPRPFNEIYPGWDWQIWRAVAPLSEVKSSNISIISDTSTIDNQRIIELDVQFDDFVNSMEFFLEKGSGISDIRINDFEIIPKATKKDDLVYVNFYAPPMEGFKFTIQTKNDTQSVRIVDRIIGLPTDLFKEPMPDNMIHGPGTRSNATLAKKSYAF